MAVTTVLVCGPATAERSAVCGMLSRVAGVTGVDAVTSSAELLARWASCPYDVVLLAVDAPGPGCVETVRRLLGEDPAANVVVLASRGDRDQVSSAIAWGARGFLSRGVAHEELSATMAAAMSQHAFGAEAVKVPSARRPEPSMPDLTERELQVLLGMASGKSNAQIGRDLYLSEDTIKTHARRLFRKLGVGDRAEAVASGFRQGLVH